MNKKNIIITVLLSIPAAIFLNYLLLIGAIFVFTGQAISSVDRLCVAIVFGVILTFPPVLFYITVRDEDI